MKQKLHQQKSESIITFGQRLLSLLSERGVTASGLSREIGLSHVAVGNYAKDRAVPSADLLLRMADFFAVNPHWLMHGTGPKYPTALQIARSQITQNQPGELSASILHRFKCLMDAARKNQCKDLEVLANETLNAETAMMAEIQEGKERLDGATQKLSNLRLKLGEIMESL